MRTGKFGSPHLKSKNEIQKRIKRYKFVWNAKEKYHEKVYASRAGNDIDTECL